MRASSRPISRPLSESDSCSWAVRLGGNKDDEPAILQWELYNASSGRVVDPRLVLPDTGLNNPRLLSLLGIVSDVVVETSEVFAPESFHSAETFERALLTIEELASRRTTISKETMFRVLVASRGARSEQLTDLEAQQMAASWDSCKVSPVPEELRLCISTFAWERCVFATAKGALGLGPAVIAAGDLVTVLDGGVVPYVLRPEKLSYRFVGACYVHGIMHGTAVQGREEGEKQIFDLR
ncbi:hypothetical protein LTS10_000880 [Elasticomyces elasticus]|nr:hypothetical protein LTS10_000880 [Elasticomyces elasticus]